MDFVARTIHWSRVVSHATELLAIGMCRSRFGWSVLVLATKIFIIEMVSTIAMGPDGWRNDRPQHDVAQRDALHRPALCQAIPSCTVEKVLTNCDGTIEKH